MERIDGRTRIRVERWDFRPLGPPVDDYATDAKSAGMLRRIVLDNTFKAVVLEIVLATIAEEKFLTIGFSKRFDLRIENPFHVFQC